MPPVFVASLVEPTQAFPVTIATALQAFATSGQPQAWLFDSAAGVQHELIGGAGDLTPTGSPSLALTGSPIAPAVASIRRGNTDGFLAANAGILDAGVGSFSTLLWLMWDPDASGASCVVVDKLVGGVGWRLETEPSSYNVKVTVNDGVHGAVVATTTTGQVFGAGSYQQGAWMALLVRWNATTRTLKLDTPRESVSAVGAAGYGSLSNASAATVGNSIATGAPLRGAIAYLLHLPGYVIADAEYVAHVRYGTTSGTGLTWTAPAGDGAATIDSRDAVVGEKLVLRDRTQPSFDQRFGNSGILQDTQRANYLRGSEEIGDGTYWANDAGLLIARDAGHAPRRGSFSASRLQKPATGSVLWTSQACTIFGGVGAGVYARATSGTGTLSLRLTAPGAPVPDQTVVFQLDNRWRLCTVAAGLGAGPFTATLYVGAGDITNATATSDVLVWGARVNNLDGAQYYPTHAVGAAAGSSGTVGASVSLPSTGQGYVEMAFVPTALPSSVLAFMYSLPVGQLGGVLARANAATRLLEEIVTNTSGQTATAVSWDYTKCWAVGKRLHQIVSWSSTATYTGVPGVGTINDYINGVGCIPTAATPPGGYPSTVAPSFVFGKDSSSSSRVGMVIERISIGSDFMDQATATSLSRAAGVNPVTRVCCLGDSITGFADGYHARLNVDLGFGDGNAVCGNFGISGENTDQLLARFQENVYQDAQGGLRAWTDLIIWAGVNDLEFSGSHSGAAVITNLKTMVGLAHGWGLRVGVLTIPPSRGRSEWTTSVQTGADQVRAAILSGSIGADWVLDVYGNFQVVASGTYNGGHAGTANGTGPGYADPRYVYDELHLTGSGADAAVPPIHDVGGQRGSDRLGDLVAAAGFGPSPAVPTFASPPVSDLLIDTALSQIESAIISTINENLRVRLPTQATIAALRAFATAGSAPGSGYRIPDNSLIFVTAMGVCYRWKTSSTTADDGVTVIKPNDAFGTTGRWLQTTSKVQAGFLKTVQLYAGEYTDDVVEARIFGQKPCVILDFVEEDPETRSQSPGAAYWNVLKFTLWCISSNLRPNAEAEIGSDLASEVLRDPGVNKIVGACKKLLAGNNLSGYTNGVAYCDIGKTRVVVEKEDERKFVFALELIVYSTIAATDSTLVQLGNPFGLAVQYERAIPHGATTVDPNNLVTSGYDVPTGVGFVKTPNAGTATVGGASVASRPIAFTFPANSDTYRDLRADGSFAFLSVSRDQPAPAVTPGALRVGKTITDGSSVVSDQYLCPTLINYGPVDQIPKP